jgi:hypothetical protein
MTLIPEHNRQPLRSLNIDRLWIWDSCKPRETTTPAEKWSLEFNTKTKKELLMLHFQHKIKRMSLRLQAIKIELLKTKPAPIELKSK